MNIDFLKENLQTKILHTAQLNQVLMELIEDEDIEKEDKEEIVNDVLKRESIMSMQLKNGVFIPRRKMENKTFKILIGITKDDIMHKDSRINIIILFLYSKEYEEQYIDLLAYMIRLFLWKSLRDSISEVEEDEEIADIIIKGISEIED